MHMTTKTIVPPAITHSASPSPNTSPSMNRRETSPTPSAGGGGGSPSIQRRREAETLQEAIMATALPGDPPLLPGELLSYIGEPTLSLSLSLSISISISSSPSLSLFSWRCVCLTVWQCVHVINLFPACLPTRVSPAHDITYLDPFLGALTGSVYITDYKMYFKSPGDDKSVS